MTTFKPSESLAGPEIGDLTMAPDTIAVPLGWRVLVVGDLLLPAEATASSTAIASELAQVAETWEGPGLFVLSGRLFDVSTGPTRLLEARRALEAHPRLRFALESFAARDDGRLVHQGGQVDGTTEPASLLAGLESFGALDLLVATGEGSRRVRIGHEGTPWDPGSPGDGATREEISPWLNAPVDAPWLEGINRLGDPARSNRFVVSRTLYRRIGRHLWWLGVPFLVAMVVRIAITPWVANHVGGSAAGRALIRAHRADGVDQLQVALGVAAVAAVVMLVVVGLLSRRLWSTLGGGAIGDRIPGTTINDLQRDQARVLMAHGYQGYITAIGFDPEYTSLYPGFFVNLGASAEVVREHRARFGLPPVFLHSEQVCWVEIGAGAELHLSLMLGRTDVPAGTRLERTVAIPPARLTSADEVPRLPGGTVLDPHEVASYPSGASWPPASDLRRLHRRTRRVRRWGALFILLAGLINLVDAITPPLRNRLHLVSQFLPLQASIAANAVLAIIGLVLIGLGRGVLRGQRRAWLVSIALLAGTTALHLLAGVDGEESLITLGILVFLVINRRSFQARSDRASVRTAMLALVAGVVGVTVLTTTSIELFTHVSHDHATIPWPTAFAAVAERLVGFTAVPLPIKADRFLSPLLLVLGVMLVIVVLYLLTRPVVDRRMVSGRAAELRARDVVRRHGMSTLDYFALRSDKRWYFHRDSMVAYAVYGGICLISPDPIGPVNERHQVWEAFRHFAQEQGWIVAIMGAGQEWLPIYRESGMHNIYLGDEAVVNVQEFSLAGKAMKGLRQAHNRVANKGYTVSFHDPARLESSLADELTQLMSLSRQGEHERGFSMMLGRIFDPRDSDLLLVVVRDPEGRAVAMCQFVPAPGIHGYSLDLMRRDPGEHPNGLIDFALCSTIEHLRLEGAVGLSLNFAAMRSTLAGDRGDGTVQRAERWILKRLSNFAQIESLWKFNAKYEPEWLARYVVYDTAEHLAPVAMAILRAESLWEIPVLGRLLSAGAERRMQAAREETEHYRARQLAPEVPAIEPAGASRRIP